MWSKFTWEVKKYKLVHKSQMCNETKANKPVIVALEKEEESAII